MTIRKFVISNTVSLKLGMFIEKSRKMATVVKKWKCVVEVVKSLEKPNEVIQISAETLYKTF